MSVGVLIDNVKERCYMDSVLRYIGKMIPYIFVAFPIFVIVRVVVYSQLFLNRSTDVDDLWLNTLGTALGVWLYKCPMGGEYI